MCLFFSYSGQGTEVDSYTMPYTRSPVYIMGILLGYFFHQTKGNIRMSPVFTHFFPVFNHFKPSIQACNCFQMFVFFGWFLAIAMYGLVSFLPALRGCTESEACGEWTDVGETVFYTLNRVMWGIWVCWLILACSTGYGGSLATKQEL